MVSRGGGLMGDLFVVLFWVLRFWELFVSVVEKIELKTVSFLIALVVGSCMIFGDFFTCFIKIYTVFDL